MKRFFLLSFFLLFIQFSCNENNGDLTYSKLPESIDAAVEEEITESFNEDIEQKIDHFFSYRNKIGRFNGVVLLAHGNKVFQKAYGYSDYSIKDSLDVNTSFQLASVSKPVTAIAVLMLEEEGKLHLGDTVQKFIPDFPYENITIEQLLAHRSGLGNYVYWTEEYWKDQNELMSNEQMLSLMTKYKPGVYYTPDRRYFYNNTNYAILASIVEKASGKDFETFLKERIFMPLGMDNSFVYSEENVKGRDIATGYKNKRRPYSKFFLDGVYGDKGLYSSVGDLWKLDKALKGGKLLSDSTRINSYTNRSKAYRKPYGLGWRMSTYNNKKLIYHHGWWRGFRTYFVRAVEEDKTVIVLSNDLRISSLNNDMLLDLIKESNTEETELAESAVSENENG